MIEFLNRHNKVNMYIFHVNYIHYAQILSLLVSFGTMLVAVIKLPETSFVSENLLRYYSLSLTIATSLYALSYALGAVRMMQDLVWYAADMSASSGREAAVYSLRGSRPD